MYEGKTVLVEGKYVCIEDMLLESSSVPTLIERVRFKTADMGDVTWKPNKKEEMMVEAEGFKIKRQRYRGLYIAELPQIIYDIRDHLNHNGSVIVKTDYLEWHKSADEMYCFLNDEHIEKMQIQTQRQPANKEGYCQG